jgi:hypothetical protein
MRPSWRKLITLLFASALLGAFTAGPAVSSPYHKCNAGGGNGYESDAANDCDPGNSGANNNGGG